MEKTENRLEEMIRYHHENEYLDFKLTEYHKNEDLLKDVLAFSNSFASGDKFIILGLKKRGDEIEFREIIKPDDSANIQQLIHQNITPELGVEYYPYVFEGKNLVVLTVKNPSNRPYSFKKDYGKLKQNECFIRKGSYNVLISRNDLDRIYSERHDRSNFNGDIDILFLNESNEFIVYTEENLELPSEKQKKEIEETIKWKEGLKKSESSYLMKSDYYNIEHDHIPIMPGQGTTYKQRSIKTLEKNLEKVHETYVEEDYVYIYEEKSEKINFSIINSSDQYLEDAMVELYITKEDGLLVGEKIYKISYKAPHPIYGGSYNPPVMSFDEMNYPNVEESDGSFIVRAELEDVRHLIKTPIFKTDLRVFFSPKLKGKKTEVIFKIFAKNLKVPLEKRLTFDIR